MRLPARPKIQILFFVAKKLHVNSINKHYQQITFEIYLKTELLHVSTHLKPVNCAAVDKWGKLSHSGSERISNRWKGNNNVQILFASVYEERKESQWREISVLVSGLRYWSHLLLKKQQHIPVPSQTNKKFEYIFHHGFMLWMKVDLVVSISTHSIGSSMISCLVEPFCIRIVSYLHNFRLFISSKELRHLARVKQTVDVFKKRFLLDLCVRNEEHRTFTNPARLFQHSL